MHSVYGQEGESVNHFCAFIDRSWLCVLFSDITASREMPMNLSMQEHMLRRAALYGYKNEAQLRLAVGLKDPCFECLPNTVATADFLNMSTKVAKEAFFSTQHWATARTVSTVEETTAAYRYLLTFMASKETNNVAEAIREFRARMQFPQFAPIQDASRKLAFIPTRTSDPASHLLMLAAQLECVFPDPEEECVLSFRSRICTTFLEVSEIVPDELRLAPLFKKEANGRIFDAELNPALPNPGLIRIAKAWLLATVALSA